MARMNGKWVYENQLIEHHRGEIKRFLSNERGIDGKMVEFVMKIYDRRVIKENIQFLHTHTSLEFMFALINDDLESLYDYTSCKETIKIGGH